MKYAYFMFGLPLIIFILAYADTKKHISMIQYIMMVFTIVLAIVLFFYIRDRIRISRSLKKIENIREYENGGIVDHSWIIEDRALCCSKQEIHEVFFKTLESVEMDTDTLVLHLKSGEQSIDMSVTDKEEAERFCAFIKRKYPVVSFRNIKPKGKGTLHDLGAGTL